MNICREAFQILTSERSKLPFVHSIMARIESTVFRIAYWSAPNFSQNNSRLSDPIQRKFHIVIRQYIRAGLNYLENLTLREVKNLLEPEQ